MKETMEKIVHDLEFTCSDLREALRKANCVSGIVLLGMVQRAEDMRRDAVNLRDAMNVDRENKRGGK